MRNPPLATACSTSILVAAMIRKMCIRDRSDSDGLVMHLVLKMTGEGIGHLPPDFKAVAAVETHRRLVLHEDPGMQLGTSRCV